MGAGGSSLQTNPLECDSKVPTLLQVSRKHAVTVCSGLIFDHNEPQPLPITCLNLERCIGEAYEESVVRGYELRALLLVAK